MGALSQGGFEFRALMRCQSSSTGIEEVQFYTDAQVASYGAHQVTLDPRREPEVEDNAQAEAHDLLGELPELMVHLDLGRRGPRGGAESPEPVVLGQAYGAPVCG